MKRLEIVGRESTDEAEIIGKFAELVEQHRPDLITYNGRGFDPAQAGAGRNGLTNMAQRMEEIGGTCAVSSQPDGGCLVIFTVPLPAARRGWFRRAAADENARPVEMPATRS